MKSVYQYYVEGENERKLVAVLSRDFKHIQSGKIEVVNVVEKRITHSYTRKLKNNTIVILIFDTDTMNTSILDSNIKFLSNCSKIKDVLCIPQVYNLEDELLRSCNIKNITEILGSSSQKEFKRDFNNCFDLGKYLEKSGFDFTKLWRKKTEGKFAGFKSTLHKIEL